MTASFYPEPSSVTAPPNIFKRAWQHILTGFRWLMGHLARPIANYIRPRMAAHPWLKQVPNALSISRILFAIPFVLWLYSRIGHPASAWLALLGLLLFALSDGIDGELARQLNLAETEFGMAIDPLGDKVLFLSLVVAYFVGVSRYALVSTTPSLGRIIAAAIIMESYLMLIVLPQKWLSKTTSVKLTGAAMVGKIKTNIQIYALLAGWPLLMAYPTNSVAPRIVALALTVSLFFNFGSVWHHSGDLVKLTQGWLDMSRWGSPSPRFTHSNHFGEVWADLKKRNTRRLVDPRRKVVS